MPEGFANLRNFQEWFSRPVEKMVEGGRLFVDEEVKSTVAKVHVILRPYLLRRLKADVEKQMPAKYEHIRVLQVIQARNATCTTTLCRGLRLAEEHSHQVTF